MDSFNRNLPPSFWDSSWVSPSLPREEAYQDPYSGSLLHHTLSNSGPLLANLCHPILVFFGVHFGSFLACWTILDDEVDAGDPWQQYMAAQMAVGGGYSPHMYSHRLVPFSIFSCLPAFSEFSEFLFDCLPRSFIHVCFLAFCLTILLQVLFFLAFAVSST